MSAERKGSENWANHRNPTGATSKHHPDQPGARDQPGTGQPGDEVMTPPEVRELEEEAEAAIEGRELEPPVPGDLVERQMDAEEQIPSEPAERAARRAEERTDHAGLED